MAAASTVAALAFSAIAGMKVTSDAQVDMAREKRKAQEQITKREEKFAAEQERERKSNLESAKQAAVISKGRRASSKQAAQSTLLASGAGAGQTAGKTLLGA